ncbi:MAG TPA: serine/threonine protein kinase, partial [Planctomycetes bacterium]|nr:serine/threonine protein kinase [Planctomycetota bacterium]
AHRRETQNDQHRLRLPDKQREARAAAAVSHDHVVAIHSIDDVARPPIIVMEFIDGQSVQQKIDKVGALDVKSILRIGMQTAAGLEAAHRQGLVHRDIKPANILLENGIERVKLTDFGLARAIDDIGMTKTGQITGTPQYMSPEQAQEQRVDHRTDLFSLGCVLYAMCPGRAAFRADSAVAVMHRIVHEEPRPVREVNEDIPDWLCEIVDKLFEKNPENRFKSAEEVEDLLGRHLAHLQQPNSVPMPVCVSPNRIRSAHEESVVETLASVVKACLFTAVLILIAGGVILSLMG